MLHSSLCMRYVAVEFWHQLHHRWSVWLNIVFSVKEEQRILAVIFLCKQWVPTLTGLHDSPGNLMNIFRAIKPFLKSYFACIRPNHYNANETGGMVNKVWMRKWIRKTTWMHISGSSNIILDPQKLQTTLICGFVICKSSYIYLLWSLSQHIIIFHTTPYMSYLSN